MELETYYIKCYTGSKKVSYPIIKFNQNDSNTCVLIFTILNDDLTTALGLISAAATVTKPSGFDVTYGTDYVVLVGNVVTFTLPMSAINEAGTCKCQIYVYGENEERKTVADFKYKILSELVNDSPAQDDVNYPILTTLINETQALADSVEELGPSGAIAEVVAARGGKENLNIRLNSVDSSLAANVQQLNDLDTNKAEQSSLDETNDIVALKATIDYVDNKVSTALSGTPKGTYATLELLQSAHPTDDTNIYIISANGHIYDWINGAWSDTGIQYQAILIAENGVTERNINYLDTSIVAINDTVNAVLDTKTIKTIKNEDIFCVGANFTLDTDGVTLVSNTTDGNENHAMYIAPNLKNLQFELAVSDTILVLGGNNGSWTGMKVGVQVGRIMDYTTSTTTIMHYESGAINIGNVGDTISVDVISGGYKLRIKRVGENTFNDWFSLLKTDYPSVTNWINYKLGFGKAGQTSNEVMAKNVLIPSILPISDNLNQLIEQVNSKAFTLADSINSRGANFAINGNNELTAIATTGIVCPNLQLDSTVKELTFTLTQSDSQVNLGGDVNNFVGVKVGVQTGRICSYTPTASAVIAYESGVITGVIGDVVNIKLVSTIYTFKIQKNGVGDFVNWFTVDKSAYTASSWTNTTLGIGAVVNVDTVTPIAKNVYLGTYLSSIALRIKMIEDKVSYVNDKWFNAIWNTLGDSITFFNYYQPIVKAKLGILTVNNYGVSSTCITATDSSDTQAMCVRYASMDNTADLVTILGGINDYYTLGGKPLGVLGDNTKYTFYGALKVLLEGVVTNNPTARVAFFTPLQCVDSVLGFSQNSLGFKLIDYVNAIKQVCEIYSIPVLDLYGGCGINQQNGTTFIGDGVHPNTIGWPRIASYISAFLDTL